MTRVEITRNYAGEIVEFKISGHSGYADIGNDIVCAGISALAQAALLGLDKVVGLNVKLNWQKGEDENFIHCLLPEKMNDEQRKMSTAVLETMCIGIKEIAKQYPKYVYIED